MELSSLAPLTGAAAPSVLDDMAILRTSRPLVLTGDLDGPDDRLRDAATTLRLAPTVTMLVGSPDTFPAAIVAAVDLCLTDEPDPPAPWVAAEPDQIIGRIAQHPLAAVAHTTLLRRGDLASSTRAAVEAESATYGMLLGGRDFQRWLAERDADRGTRAAAPVSPALAITRTGSTLRVRLDRPERRNAIDSVARDELVDTFGAVLIDDSITRVVLEGAGPSFCAGGDLDEFGTAADGPASYAARLTRHPGWALHRVADRVEAHLHGHCIGAGIEIPAFASTVLAEPSTLIALPEITMGLIPGAGGTASITRRIGPQRTNWLALSGQTIDAHLAHRWGLVDALTSEPG